MKKNQIYLTLFLVFFLSLIFIEDSFAGPGGTITKALFKTWWGKLLMLALTILIAPVIIYHYIVQTIKVKKTKKALIALGTKNKDFSWLNMEKNIKNIFTRTYEAWSNGDMAEVQNYVNHWYWKNQQMVVLDKWEKQNLKNICNLDKVKSIKPLYVEISEEEKLEGSKVAILVSASIEDYLIDKATGKAVEGGKGYIDEEHIWIFEYDNGKWLLDNIASEDYTFTYIKMENIIPEYLIKP
ncbi:hypothetical protein [Wenyingzhuangia sp. IMCC45574]